MDDVKVMKAITLWQPWASLLASGAKQFETRSWATRYRGQIAIHASAKSIRSIMRECFPCGDWEYHPSYTAKARFLDAVEKFVDIDCLPLGAIIATAELVGCHPIVEPAKIEGMVSTGKLIQQGVPVSVYGNELYFGDWTPGRFAWEIENVKLLPEPVPCKGAQGLWNVVQSLEE